MKTASVVSTDGKRKEVGSMKNYRDYNRRKTGKTVPMIISIVALIGMIVLNLAVPEPVLEPDAVYPMANAHIDWLESFHSGGWEE